MGDENSPSKGSPINLTPSGRVVTNWQTLVTVIGCTIVVVGGLLTIRHDIADSRRDAREALDALKEVRSDLFRLRVQLNVFDHVSASPTSPRSPQP